MQFWPYILTWRLAAALVLIGLAVIPIRKAYRMLRNGEVWTRGTVEEVFLSSLLVSLATSIYPFAILGILLLWYLFIRKHILTLRGFLSSWIAMAVVAIYTVLVCYIFHISYWPW